MALMNEPVVLVNPGSGSGTEIAELERTLAADWSNVDALAAHKQGRDALQALLARWEELFS